MDIALMVLSPVSTNYKPAGDLSGSLWESWPPLSGPSCLEQQLQTAELEGHSDSQMLLTDSQHPQARTHISQRSTGHMWVSAKSLFWKFLSAVNSLKCYKMPFEFISFVQIKREYMTNSYFSLFKNLNYTKISALITVSVFVINCTESYMFHLISALTGFVGLFLMSVSSAPPSVELGSMFFTERKGTC